jgi:integrase
MRQRKITVREYSDSNRPEYKFVVNYREAGKRKRKFFEVREPANAFAALKNAELRKFGIEGTKLPGWLRDMAQECAAMLSEYKRADSDSPPTIRDATDYLIAHLKASQRSITATALVDQIIDEKKADGMSVRYVQDLRSRLPRFAKKFDGKMVATITSVEIDNWLRSLQVGATTRNNFRRTLVMMFNYAVDRGYAASNPAAKTAKAKVVDSPPGILTPQQTARLLEAASRELLPYVAIGAFAGLRRAELERLAWSDVHFDGDQLIEVTAQKSKTARRRFVKIQPNLREWLIPVRKHSGKVTPDNFAKQFDAAREAACITEWPDNALRHSFASYHLAHFKDAAALALEMGHTDSGIIFNHYRELVRPREAQRYWNIKPARESKVVPMTRTEIKERLRTGEFLKAEPMSDCLARKSKDRR